MFNLHEKQEDLIFHRSTLSENEIENYCKHHHLTILKHIRHKNNILSMILNLINKTSYQQVYQLPPIYITLCSRIAKTDFDIIKNAFSQLSLSKNEINNILKLL